MKYSSSTREKVRELRLKGYSLNEIHTQTHVPKTTIRLWIKNITLSKEQIELLKTHTQEALQKGRVAFQQAQKEKRQTREEELASSGKKETTILTQKELLIAGIALYWGEGFKNKHEHRLGFCNSDPEMINFYITWLQRSLGIRKNDLVLRVTINSSYKEKTKEIEKYWSDITKIPLDQFTKTFYQYSEWKKQYKTDAYHGVLRIHVKGSWDYLWKMKGWITGLKHAKIS